MVKMDPPDQKLTTLWLWNDLSRPGRIPGSSQELGCGGSASGGCLNVRTYVFLDLLQPLLCPEAAIPNPLDLVSLSGSFRLELDVVSFLEDLQAIVFLLSVSGAGKVDIIVVDVNVDVADAVGPFHWTSWIVRSMSLFLNSR